MSTPQQSSKRRKQKARRTKQLAAWRERRDQDANKTAATKKSEPK